MLSFKEIVHLEKDKKARDAQGLFVAEGKKLFLEAPPELILQVLTTARFARENPDLLEKLPEGTSLTADISEERFRSLSDTKTPQGILTVLKKPEWPGIDPQQLLMQAENGRKPLLCILEELQDPGNAGTILRTSEAAGVTAVYLTETSVDLYSPKVIRSTMGAIFRVPHKVVPSAEKLVRDLTKRGINVYAAHLRGERTYWELDLKAGSAFVIGNESRGISALAASACTDLIRIPMQGQVESLNAAMAAGILLYEAARQRRGSLLP